MIPPKSTGRTQTRYDEKGRLVAVFIDGLMSHPDSWFIEFDENDRQIAYTRAGDFSHPKSWFIVKGGPDHDLFIVSKDPKNPRSHAIYYDKHGRICKSLPLTLQNYPFPYRVFHRVKGWLRTLLNHGHDTVRRRETTHQHLLPRADQPRKGTLKLRKNRVHPPETR